MTDATPQILDVEDGLNRLMGDQDLYLKILRRFRADHRHSATQIRRALKAEDVALAQHQAHTLKGAAGMIGARHLHAVASALEGALRAGAGAAGLAQLGQALEQVIGRLDPLLPPEDAPAPDVPAAPLAPEPATLILLESLADLLREGDGAAIDVLEQSASLLAASLGVPRYQAVAAAAHEFDFDAALDALEAARLSA